MGTVNTGIKFEYLVRDYLQHLGYTVIRAAGSRGPADLIAFSANVCILIQCKKEVKKRPYKDDIDRIKGVTVPPGFKKQLWIKHKTDIQILDFTRGREKSYNMKLKELKS